MIMKTTKKDAGLYECVATNALASVSSSCKLSLAREYMQRQACMHTVYTWWDIVHGGTSSGWIRNQDGGILRNGPMYHLQLIR